METEVKGHYITRKGKRIYIEPHEMHVNERVHKRHEKRLEEEAEALEEMEHEAEHEHMRMHKVRV
jgi:hypothetical protein